MPKFLEMYGWRFFAVMFDLLNEPFHIHVTDKGKKECKYWVIPDGHMQLAYNRGFSTADRNKIERAIKENLPTILNQYKTYCDENNIKPTYKTLR
ncbi:DUF4160 domain-containing protein [Spirosoma sp. KUDC1026]|uniref:DUF4160 domain-containing protein n=1 Tax=Spirosoma sp. KUDC1026 TaxID=2745947 RepID=UPI00159BED6F|nr:DUF4160 domain-containing protein [Spirosoma sp. KUDC1026]QKZ15144.1 DUF4160 domain-containing protein [Spirosoma sp. KUDC1026]